MKRFVPFIFILFSASLVFSQKPDSLTNPCDSKSDCTGCPCLLKNDLKYTLGIDLAFQGIEGGLADIKWDSVLTNSNIKFILLKKSTGCDTSTKRIKYWKSYVTREKVAYDNDWFFYKNWDLLKGIRNTSANNFYVGVYHYFYNNVSPELQSVLFLRNLNLSADDLPPVLDLEDTAMANIDGKTLGDNILQWIEQVENSTHRKVIIYTSRYYWDKYRSKLDPESINKILLHTVWQAQFNNKKNEPDLLNGWKNWNFWQYCGDCYVNGIKGELDVNVFNGTETDLQNFINDSIIK